MTPNEALNVLDVATQPGVRMRRVDYVMVEQALFTLKQAITPPDDEKVEQPSA